MNQEIKNYISNQALDRQELLLKIHETIIALDPNLELSVEIMMRNEMILYKSNGMMKYGLAGLKKYMTLHVLPIYMSAPLSVKFKTLLNKASFQKGCINFNNADEMPLEIVAELITDCSKIDLLKIRDDYYKLKKQK